MGCEFPVIGGFVKGHKICCNGNLRGDFVEDDLLFMKQSIHESELNRAHRLWTRVDGGGRFARRVDFNPVV